MKICAGTSGYSYREWKGRFYPERIPSKEMLSFYAGRLRAVEINSTFYRMPSEGVLRAWGEQVPEEFVFALKAPQVITHLKRLREATDETLYLFSSLAALDRKLGPVLFQLPGSFHADLSALKDFLNLIPSGVACAFEFRSPSWITRDVLALLHEKGIGLCITDTDEKPAEEIISTASWGYLRLRRSGYTDAALAQWLERVLSQSWERAFVFFKHEQEAPEMAMRFQKLADSGGEKA